MSVTTYENDQTTTEDLDTALKRLETKYGLNASEVDYLHDGETVLWEEDDETVELVIIQGE